MKAGAHKIEVEARLILNRRELLVLNHICSYDNGKAAEMIAANTESKSYCGGVTKQEIEELLKNIRSETQTLMNEIQEAQKTLFKQ